MGLSNTSQGFPESLLFIWIDFFQDIWMNTINHMDRRIHCAPADGLFRCSGDTQDTNLSHGVEGMGHQQAERQGSHREHAIYPMRLTLSSVST